MRPRSLPLSDPHFQIPLEVYATISIAIACWRLTERDRTSNVALGLLPL